jgi:hypothetical protein
VAGRSGGPETARRTGRPRPEAEVAVVLQGTTAPEAEGKEADRASPARAQADARRDLTKPPGDAERLLREPEGPPNRRRPRESPRGSIRQGDGERLRPEPRPERGRASRFRPSSEAPGRAAKPSGQTAIRKGDRTGFGLDASLRRRRGFGRAGSDGGARDRILPERPTGIGEGLRASLREPPGAERGFAASLRDPRKATRAFAPASRSESRPARDGLATQRRQSKLGQVGAGGDTGPHSDSAPKVTNSVTVTDIFRKSVTVTDIAAGTCLGPGSLAPRTRGAGNG